MRMFMMMLVGMIVTAAAVTVLVRMLMFVMFVRMIMPAAAVILFARMFMMIVRMVVTTSTIFFFVFHDGLLPYIKNENNF